MRLRNKSKNARRSADKAERGHMNCEALLFDPDIDEGGLIARAGDCFAPRKYCVKFYPKNRTESLRGFLHDISLKQLPTVEVVIKALDDESSSGECRFTLETEEGVWSTISHFTIHVYDEFRNKGVGTDLILCMHFIINSIDRNLVKMTHSEINPEDESYFSRLLAFYRRSGFIIGKVGNNDRAIVERKPVCTSSSQIAFLGSSIRDLVEAYTAATNSGQR